MTNRKPEPQQEVGEALHNLEPDWPTVPNEIAGTEGSTRWIEGRDAAVRAFIRALNELPVPQPLQGDAG